MRDLKYVSVIVRIVCGGNTVFERLLKEGHEHSSD